MSRGQGEKKRVAPGDIGRKLGTMKPKGAAWAMERKESTIIKYSVNKNWSCRDQTLNWLQMDKAQLYF